MSDTRAALVPVHDAPLPVVYEQARHALAAQGKLVIDIRHMVGT